MHGDHIGHDYDLDSLNIFLFQPTLKATYEILLQLAFEEMFEIVKLWQVLGQRSNNDLDLFYSQIFMNSLRQLCHFLGKKLENFA